MAEDDGRGGGGKRPDREESDRAGLDDLERLDVRAYLQDGHRGPSLPRTARGAAGS